MHVKRSGIGGLSKQTRSLLAKLAATLRRLERYISRRGLPILKHARLRLEKLLVEHDRMAWYRRFGLTPVERTICELLRRGYRAIDIAVRRNRKVATIHRHCHNIRMKMGLRGRQQTLRACLRAA